MRDISRGFVLFSVAAASGAQPNRERRPPPGRPAAPTPPLCAPCGGAPRLRGGGLRGGGARGRPPSTPFPCGAPGPPRGLGPAAPGSRGGRGSRRPESRRGVRRVIAAAGGAPQAVSGFAELIGDALFPSRGQKHCSVHGVESARVRSAPRLCALSTALSEVQPKFHRFGHTLSIFQ